MVKAIRNNIDLWKTLSSEVSKRYVSKHLRTRVPIKAKNMSDEYNTIYDLPSKEKPKRKKRTKKNVIDLTIDHSFCIEQYWADLNERLDMSNKDILDFDFEYIQSRIDEFSDLDSNNLVRELLSIIFELTKNNQADFILLKHELTRELWENYVDLFNKIKQLNNDIDEKDTKRNKALSKLTKEEKILLGLV